MSRQKIGVTSEGMVSALKEEEAETTESKIDFLAVVKTMIGKMNRMTTCIYETNKYLKAREKIRGIS